MKTIEFYEVSDVFTADGRGPMTIIGRFTNVDDATYFSKGNGNYGADANVSTKKTIVVMDSLEESAQYQNEIKRANILKKLTKEERDFLGI